MILRPRFFLWLLFTVTTWLISHLGEWAWLNLLMFFLILLPFFSFIALLINRRRIKIAVKNRENHVERNENASWFFNIKSSLYFLTCYLSGSYREQSQADFEYLAPFPIHGQEELNVSLEILARHTGPLKPNYFELRILDSLGFFTLPVMRLAELEFNPVLVLPKSLVAVLEKEESRAYMEGGEAISKKSEHNLDEIDLVRPMRPGDTMKNIHWKVSARVQDWMVRQYEKADENELSFIFNIPSVNPLDNNSESLLSERDNVLDHVSEAAQSLLNQDFTLKVQLRRPWLDTVSAKDLGDYEYLRISLSSLPYIQRMPFAQQLREESLDRASRFYCIFTHDLNEEICTELLVLASFAQGILLRLISPTANPPHEWHEHIKKLAAAGIKIVLNRNNNDPITGREEGL